MGLSSSQARLLTLTGRMHDIECRAARLEAQKLQMANESTRVYNDYLEAIDASKIQFATISTDGSLNYIDATYNKMIENDYLLEFSSKIRVTQVQADNFELANGNKDYFVYLQTGVSGAPDGYTAIFTIEQLQNIGLDGKYMLMSDIDLGGIEWSSIGSSTSPFRGTFDGNGHTISNLMINSSDNGAGLFGVIEGATLTNIQLSNANVKTNANCAGALVGLASNSTISNCQLRNVSVNGNARVGGLGGYIVDGVVSNCSVTGVNVKGVERCGGFVGHTIATNYTDCLSAGNVVALNRYAGGFAGSMYGADASECLANTNVSIISSTTNTNDFSRGIYSGGFVGSLGSDGGNISHISGCGATGSVYGQCDVGGFAGINDDGFITNSYATGDVHTNISELNSNVGNETSCLNNVCETAGFVGANWGEIRNSFATGNVDGLENIGGFVGNNNRGASVISCMSSGFVTTTISSPVGDVGGFIGDNKSNTIVEDCFYSSNLSSQTNAFGTNASANMVQMLSNRDINNAINNNINEINSNINITSPSVQYKNTSEEAKTAEELFDKMSEFGYILESEENDSILADHGDDAVWFANMVNGGYLSIYKKNELSGEYYEVSVATDTNLQEVQDKNLLRKAEAKYEADMLRIDKKDRKYDIDLAALENERSAIKQEIETLKTVAKDNVERTFKLFS